MINSILVPTDFSTHALTAARYALEIGRQQQCPVHIMHAYTSFRSAFQSELANKSDEERAQIEATSGLDAFIASLGEDSTSSSVSSSLFKGQLLEGIEAATKKYGVSLLVMGTNGASGLKYGLLGSNTFNVAKSSGVALLVVPPQVDRFSIDKVVFFSDYQQQDMITLKALASLFGKDIVACHLVHIHGKPSAPTPEDHERIKSWQKKLIAHTGMDQLIPELVQGEEHVTVVNDIIDRLQAGIAVLTLPEKGFFEKLVNKSLAKAIIHQPKLPVLLVNSVKKEVK